MTSIISPTKWCCAPCPCPPPISNIFLFYIYIFLLSMSDTPDTHPPQPFCVAQDITLTQTLVLTLTLIFDRLRQLCRDQSSSKPHQRFPPPPPAAFRPSNRPITIIIAT
ncbi:putative sulfated surface glycoprotein 185-like [Iris pallida]|uniref:Sulfated surface glycoprotein 185-like n=1 Tax=Iris pallida TaxID=29817 RepID=A0AAX6E0E7_IRIPA|nr:putative sulfated surface glycoprotein 185-like [Iris pallida]